MRDEIKNISLLLIPTIVAVLIYFQNENFKESLSVLSCKYNRRRVRF